MSVSPLDSLRTQRSHVLLVLSHPRMNEEQAFLHWYRSSCSLAIATLPGVLTVHCYEQDEVDLTRGRYPRLPFKYLAFCELSLDGPEAAEKPIERIAALHREQPAAQAPATWLYYPASEKVGRASCHVRSMVTVAFANALPDHGREFREFYATRHIRHALNIPALVSGQCFERTRFQRPGAMEARFETIAVYEQEGSSESIVRSFATLPPGTIDFPLLDRSRFAESSYRRI